MIVTEDKIAFLLENQNALRADLKLAVDALVSIADMSHDEAISKDYWKDKTEIEQTLANDTVIARDALKGIMHKA